MLVIGVPEAASLKAAQYSIFYRMSCKFLSRTGGHALDFVFLMSLQQYTLSFVYCYHILSNKELSAGWLIGFQLPLWAYIICFQDSKTSSGAFPNVFPVGTGGSLSAVKAC
jgi:hypothetical protein